MVSVLFVCMGNICRSPTAEGVFRKLVVQQTPGSGLDINIDSAGTLAYHVGNPPDERSQRAAMLRGIDLGALRARKVGVDDFYQFDYILAMDRDNYSELESICPAGEEARLGMFLAYAPSLREQEVPDPYYGGGNGFERVLDMIEAAAAGLLEDIQQRYS